jgi:hypothetical protein
MDVGLDVGLLQRARGGDDLDRNLLADADRLRSGQSCADGAAVLLQEVDMEIVLP